MQMGDTNVLCPEVEAKIITAEFSDVKGGRAVSTNVF